MPRLPLPAKRSSTCADRRSKRLARMLNRAPLTLSAVGRTACPLPARSRRPLALPAITRMHRGIGDRYTRGKRGLGVLPVLFYLIAVNGRARGAIAARIENT